MTASLKGIRVLEMSQIMAGPTCGLLLADLGAEVIKIEKTPTGDDTRNFLPPDINGEAAAFMMMNRNKKGIALNLKDKDGIKIFKEMVKNSDVVLPALSVLPKCVLPPALCGSTCSGCLPSLLGLSLCAAPVASGMILRTGILMHKLNGPPTALYRPAAFLCVRPMYSSDFY